MQNAYRQKYNIKIEIILAKCKEIATKLIYSEPSFEGRWRKTARLFCDGRFFVAKQHFTEGETFIKTTIQKSVKMDEKEPLPVNQNLKGLARNGRTNQTPEERKIWYDYLNKVKPRFHRQRVIGNYIVDFYSPKLKIIIEIDGYQHYYEENREYDKKRTEYLEGLGFVGREEGICVHSTAVVKKL